MTDITWGPEIAVNGVRPAWLSDDAQYRPTGESGAQYPARCEHDRTDNHLYWRYTGSIRLPADHFAYVAIDKGFEPWGGGDAAPDDWDGDAYGVLYRDGLTIGRKAVRWEKYDTDNDIIGYRKRTETPADTMTIARMTEDEARARWPDDIDDASGAERILRDLGLIRSEPINPLMLKAREIAARHVQASGPNFAETIKRGERDDAPMMLAVLEALRG